MFRKYFFFPGHSYFSFLVKQNVFSQNITHSFTYTELPLGVWGREKALTYVSPNATCIRTDVL